MSRRERSANEVAGNILTYKAIAFILCLALLFIACFNFVLTGQDHKLDIAIMGIELEVDGREAKVATIGESVTICAIITNYEADKSGNIVVQFFYIEELSSVASFIDERKLPGLEQGKTLKAEITWDTSVVNAGKYTFVATATLVDEKEKDSCPCNNEIPRGSCPNCMNEDEDKLSPILPIVHKDAYFVKPLKLGTIERVADEDLEHEYPWGGRMGADGQLTKLMLYNLGQAFSTGDFDKSSIKPSYRIGGVGRFTPDDDILIKINPWLSVAVSLKPPPPTPEEWRSGNLGLVTTNVSFAFLGNQLEKEDMNLAKSYQVELRYDFRPNISGLQSLSSSITFPNTSAGEILKVYPPVNLWSYPDQKHSAPDSLNTEGRVDVAASAGEAGIYHVIKVKETSKLIALSPQGEKKWEYTLQTGSKVTSPVVVAGSTIYASSSEGTIHVIEDNTDDYTARTTMVGEEAKELTQPLVVVRENDVVVIVGSNVGLHIISYPKGGGSEQHCIETVQNQRFKVTKPPISITPGNDTEIWFAAETSSRTYLAHFPLPSDIKRIDMNITSAPVVEVSTQLRTNASWRAEDNTEIFVFFGSTNGDLYAKYAGPGDDPNPNGAKRDITVQGKGVNNVTGLQVAKDAKNADVLYAATEDGGIYKVEFKVNPGSFEKILGQNTELDGIAKELTVLRDADDQARAVFVTSYSPKHELIGFDVGLKPLKLEKIWEVKDIPFRFLTGYELTSPASDTVTEPDDKDGRKKGTWKLLIGSADGILYVLNLEEVADMGQSRP